MYKSKFAGFTWFDMFHFGGLVFFWVLPNGKTQSESTSHAMQQSCPCTSLSRPHRLVVIKWITVICAAFMTFRRHLRNLLISTPSPH